MPVFVYMCLLAVLLKVPSRALGTGGHLDELVRQVTEELPNLLFRSVEVRWPDSWAAANTKLVLFRLEEGRRRENVEVEIFTEEERLIVTSQWVEDGLEVVFPARKAGKYRFHLISNGHRHAPWEKHVVAGLPDCRSCRLGGLRTATEVIEAGTTFALRLEVKDAFGNRVDCSAGDCDDVHLELDRGAATGSVVLLSETGAGRQMSVRTRFSEGVSGSFSLAVRYKGEEVLSFPLKLLNIYQRT